MVWLFGRYPVRCLNFDIGYFELKHRSLHCHRPIKASTWPPPLRAVSHVADNRPPRPRNSWFRRSWPLSPTPSTFTTMTCGPRPGSRPASISRSPWSQTTTAHELPGKSRANSLSTSAGREGRHTILGGARRTIQRPPARTRRAHLADRQPDRRPIDPGPRRASHIVRGAEARPLRAVRTFWDAHSCAMALPLVGNDTAPQWAVCSISRMCDNWTLGRSLLTSNCGVALRRQKRAGHVSGRLGRSGWD